MPIHTKAIRYYAFQRGAMLAHFPTLGKEPVERDGCSGYYFSFRSRADRDRFVADPGFAGFRDAVSSKDDHLRLYTRNSWRVQRHITDHP